MKGVFKKSSEVAAFYKSLPYWHQPSVGNTFPTPNYLYNKLEILDSAHDENSKPQVFCCFHEGHSKSLTLDMKTGGYHCFSKNCGVQGNMIDFVEMKLNLDYLAAVEYLELMREEELKSKK